MSERKNPSLTDILAEFGKIRGEKTAEDGMAPEAVPPQAAMDPAAAAALLAEPQPVPEGGEPCPECGAPVAAPTSAADVAQAAANVEDAEAQVVDAASALQEVADAFIDDHTSATVKEAQIFGELFAESFTNTMQKKAAVQDAHDAAYQATMQKMAEEQQGQRLGQVYQEAYAATMCKLAEEEAYQAALQQLDPEQLAALQAAAEEPVPEGEQMPEPTEMVPGMYPASLMDPEGDGEAGSDEGVLQPHSSLQAMAADAVHDVASAADSNAEAVQAAAEAAQGLVDSVYAGEPEAVPDLPKMASDAYALTQSFLRRQGA